jgi:steroid delta-isomerase-like uncharacterized protein
VIAAGNWAAREHFLSFKVNTERNDTQSDGGCGGRLVKGSLTMSVEENKALIRRAFQQAVNEKRVELFDEVLAPNYTNYTFPAPAPGPEGFKQVMAMFFNAFPDMIVELQDVIGEGDKVVTRGVMRGTHQGEFMGIPATGKPIEVNYIDIWRIENGQGVDNWVQLDMMGMMQQLGVIPAPGQAPA